MSAHLGGFLVGNVLGLGYFSHLWAEDNWWHLHGKVEPDTLQGYLTYKKTHTPRTLLGP